MGSIFHVFNTPVLKWTAQQHWVSLFSLTYEAYLYYKALLSQFENDGGTFKPSPASPPSNISNGALGIFRASALDTMSIIMNEHIL